MPVTEVQWIGASCGRHSSYTFYRGFRLIVDGVKKNFCLGEFYFVRNSTNQPICIAELQLVWHDASTDSQLASARLYFRPEDTPLGRLPNHGQDELLYADQKVVIKCQDMAVWQDSGLQWNFGMVPLYESDFVCINDNYYLSSHYLEKEKERLLKAREAWQNGDRSLRILTFPAYCRYRALKERLLSGACLTKPQLVALGGVLGDETSTRVLFCRDSFHHPDLDKFELSGDNKAPVLKGRPRKKKKLNAPQNSVLKKKRFVAEIQNHLTNSSAAKRCKISEEEEESASSDISEAGVSERIKMPPQAARAAENNGPPPLIKPKVQVISPKPSEIPKAAAQNVPSANPKAPPPLISANKTKDAPCITQPNREQLSVKVIESSGTMPLQKQIYSMDAKLKRVDQSNNSNSNNNNNNNNNTAGLVKSHLADNIQPNVTSAPFTSTSSSLESRTGKILNLSAGNDQPLHLLPGKTVTNANSKEQIRKIPAVQADVRSNATSSARPVATTQGTVGTQLAVSISPAVRSQPIASMPQPVSSSQAITSKSQQFVTPLGGSTSTTVKASDGVNTGSALSVRSKQSKENEEWQFRSASKEKKDNEKEQSEEPVVWKKKKKRLRMPGSVKDEVYDDEDEKYFMQTLRDFMRKSNQPLGKLPALGFKKVNLWTMYTTAQRFGGYDAVTSKRLWRRVYDSLGGSTTITSAATYTRRHYERLLLPYERHIRSQLKKQMDEKNPSTVNKPAAKEPINKPEKKQGLAVSNNKPKPSVCSDTNKAPAVKQNQGANPAKTQRSNTALSSVQALPVKMRISSDAKGNAVKITVADSVHSSGAVTTSSNSKSSQAPVRPVQQDYKEAKTWSDKTRTSVSQPVSLADKKEMIPSEQYQVASGQQNTNYHCVKVMSSDEETSARTNTIYTKNKAAMNSNSKQSVHGAPLQRVTHNGIPMSSPPQQLNTAVKGREIIDLTSEESPPRPQSRSLSLPHGQGSQSNSQEITKAPRPVSGRDTDGPGRRHSSKSHSRKEYNDGSSRHQSIREVQPSREMSPVYDKPTYNVKPQIKPKMSDSLPVSRVETMDGRFMHTPSSDSVDEHFAEWLRRQSNIPQQHTKSHASHQIQTGNQEMGKLRYNYKEDICPPDCSCSLSTSRKDEIMSIAPPKPKKEHYEEDLPFAGMTLYPGRWSPTMIGADHHDLYISSHAAHLPAPPDSLASHMCTASRIFIPTAQIFSPPYHLGVAPMGASPLMAGTDDQLHIHPHCLMASSYPCTSNSRTPDGAAYPLYSFT